MKKLNLIVVFNPNMTQSLFCIRSKEPYKGLYNFVGGKVEEKETMEQALIRECREELDITVAVDDVFMEVQHEYPDLLVRLTLFNATIAEGTPKMLEHNDIRWIFVEEIPQYDFCPADVDILKRLMEEKGHDRV